ncbi:hypothetical protein [Chryseobacterium sp.]|uniref:hypothetical protein n=1 Tax=Chryseobacterium sp. TaxID=1871047 RepID=UPI00289A3BEA|nr:hypothetical protein [Chryseobacterium sp.]
MSFDRDFKIIRKKFENENIHERIRLGNNFVDDFIFGDSNSADIPINALRVIFNIISIISNEQFRPEDRPKQLSLFDEEFETENNLFASMKIRNSKISPSGSTKQVIEAYEFLAKFKMGWYKSVNSKGKEIKTFGGLISTPSYDQRGFTSFLISSYWLKKLIVIPVYNYILYNRVYNLKNNKHILFAIWLSKIPEKGTILKLSTLNKKFGLNYKTSNDFCFKFLKQVRINLNQFSNVSFNYKYCSDDISILPYLTERIVDKIFVSESKERLEITYRLNYFKRKYQLKETEFSLFSNQYRNVPQTRDLIEKAYRNFIKTNRKNKLKSSDFSGEYFLRELQKFIIEHYQTTKMGKLLPKGYPVIIQIEHC